MRIVVAVLADPEHTLPIPGQPGMLFPATGRPVDLDDPFWLSLVKDGSLKIASEESVPSSLSSSFAEPDAAH